MDIFSEMTVEDAVSTADDELGDGGVCESDAGREVLRLRVPEWLILSSRGGVDETSVDGEVGGRDVVGGGGDAGIECGVVGDGLGSDGVLGSGGEAGDGFVIAFADGASVLIAEAEVEGEIGTRLPIVLEVSGPVGSVVGGGCVEGLRRTFGLTVFEGGESLAYGGGDGSGVLGTLGVGSLGVDDEVLAGGVELIGLVDAPLRANPDLVTVEGFRQRDLSGMDVVGLKSGIGVAQCGESADFNFGESRRFGVCSGDGVGIDSEIGGGGLGRERGNSSESGEGVTHVHHCCGVQGEDVVEQYRMVLQGKGLAAGVGEKLVLSRLRR